MVRQWWKSGAFLLGFVESSNKGDDLLEGFLSLLLVGFSSVDFLVIKGLEQKLRLSFVHPT